jgi:hypothetical protein
VLKHGGAITTTNETYALAFEFFSVQLSVTATTNGVLLSWPVFPDGFQLQASASPGNLSWTDVNITPAIANGQNTVFVGTGVPWEYFRLSRERNP